MLKLGKLSRYSQDRSLRGKSAELASFEAIKKCAPDHSPLLVDGHLDSLYIFILFFCLYPSKVPSFYKDVTHWIQNYFFWTWIPLYKLYIHGQGHNTEDKVLVENGWPYFTSDIVPQGLAGKSSLNNNKLITKQGVVRKTSKNKYTNKK